MMRLLSSPSKTRLVGANRTEATKYRPKRIFIVQDSALLPRRPVGIGVCRHCERKTLSETLRTDNGELECLQFVLCVAARKTTSQPIHIMSPPAGNLMLARSART